ncbi:M20 metallopeptidase family protein [Desulfospira joergensenii]|uniref:M20 metallopeptidase family protein n=1 Tax=Desulfospira joergensenii TaxID=53329 RepID=UPI0003B3DC92|nr:amidohydrolase [Desulfospira joergensenii]
MDHIQKRILELKNETLELRRHFHMNPELGFQEFQTADKIENFLQDIGLKTTRMTQTGVVAVLDSGRPGPCLMLRADMDGLPVTEETDLPYKSRNKGVMHACGHDAHMAMLLTAAKVLKENKAPVTGKIKFVFQPNEEIAGAIHMIEDGVLENPKVDAAMGLHVWTPVDSGKIAITPGPVMGGLDVFKITIHGKGGHTGVPEDAVDPVIAAANLIQTAQIIQTREISNLKATVIMFGKIKGGTKSNIIPDKVELEGSIRFLYPGGPESEEKPTQRFIRIAEQVCLTHRCTCDIDIIHENIPLINHAEMTALARETALDVFPSEKDLIDNQTIASEDFSEFSRQVPGVFVFLGAGNDALGANLSHHHPKFNIDETILPKGVEMLVRSAFHFFEKADQLSFLKQNQKERVK